MALDACYILVTDGDSGSRRKNWLDNGHPDKPDRNIGLKRALEDSAFTNVEALDVSIGENEDEMWEIFNKVAELVPEKADIYVDLTHGFRTLPMLVLLALEYVEKVKGARIVELTYGANKPDATGLAPTWNLEPFLVIRKWADAVESFLAYGDTRPLAECSRKPARELKKQLRQSMPEELYRLHGALQVFGEAIQKCHSPGILEAAKSLREILAKASDQSKNHGPLQPLSFLLHKVESKLKYFPLSADAPTGELRAQWAAAEWCCQHGLAIQCLTFLREGFVRAFDQLLRQRSDLNCSGDKLVGCIGRLSSKQGLNPEAKAIVAVLNDKPITSDRVWEGLLKHMGSLVELRNKLDHAYSGYSDKAPISAHDFEKNAKCFLALFQQLIEDLNPTVSADVS
jgi:CRISPR-associated DxTHG motif protein